MAWSAGAILTASQLNTYLAQVSTSFVPALTNVNLGATPGTVTGNYARIGPIVFVQVSINFNGAGSALGGVPSVTNLPFTATGTSTLVMRLFDNSTATNHQVGSCRVSGTTIDNPVGATGGLLNATVPFTWATLDAIHIAGTYLTA